MLPLPYIKGIVWPAVPDQQAAGLLAMLFQLEQSQWLSPELIQLRQLEQAAFLLQHALKTVPFYRDKYRGIKFRPLDMELWHSLPILEPAEVQKHFDSLRSTAIPEDHGQLITYSTHSSDGEQAKVLGSELTDFFTQVLSVRDHLWHRRDFTGKHAVIRPGAEVANGKGWGKWSRQLLSGETCSFDSDSDIAEQVKWLQQEQPAYLLTQPSNCLALANYCIDNGIQLEGLRDVRTFGEDLPDELRALCDKAWSVKLVDHYSCDEVGTLALQCPEHEHYHVQSENVLLEVLNDQDQPCEIGETGNVVITSLHNFAMPLLRYRLPDKATLGERCDCGRGLPVIKSLFRAN